MIELNALLKFLLFNSCLILSYGITFFSIPILCVIADKFNVLDVPDGKLKLHKKVVPYLGGLGIYLGFISGICLNNFIHYSGSLNIYFLIGITFLMICGLFDDLYIIKPITKLFVQFFASLFFIIALIQQGHNYYIFVWPLIIFWFMSIMNAINLIDIMDGLSSVCSLCSLIIFFIISILTQNFYLALLLLPLIGSIFAFFLYNKPPAKIYMGDSGSLFIGGFLAYIPFELIKDLKSIIHFSILVVPALELIALVIIRIYKRLPIYLGSPDHFAIYLQNRNWSKQRILLLVSSFSILFGIASLCYLINCINLYLLIISFLFLMATWIKIIYV